jgi:hypothetical protein
VPADALGGWLGEPEYQLWPKADPCTVTNSERRFKRRHKEEAPAMPGLLCGILVELDYDLVLAVSGIHVVLSLSYLNPGALFSASLVVSIVR